jgi:hypothetical protein
VGFKGQAPAPDVNVSITVGGKDFYLWACVAGEQLAPTLTGSGATFSRAGNVPALALQPASSSLPNAVWGAVGAIGPDPTKTVLVVQCEFRLPYAQSTLRFGYGQTSPVAGTPGLAEITYQSFGMAGTNGTLMQPGTTPVSVVPPYTRTLDLNVWHTLTMRYPGKVLIDGVQVYTQSFSPSVPTPRVTPAIPADSAWALSAESAAVGYAAYVRNVYATWEKP